MPYSSSRWRSLVISLLVSFITFLTPPADIDEPQTVVLQTGGRERGELFGGRFVCGGLVAEGRQDNLGAVGHGNYH